MHGSPNPEIGTGNFRINERRREMHVIEIAEMNIVSGGASLAQPIDNPQSELGKSIDDVAQLCNNFGTWLGGAIYEAVH